ncbi:hypothetical protein [Pseudobacteriovorax antillogorgiicola]|uniref:Uncharacterized protein n=1 Tax=Pseudobacteriovorax antillogorgiicola TaxID=1513793 RepID=A0A1Y6BZB5_9BACT|nr:hypothetical protein [Pseudobacteriovorax antillogorgiicola]TCS52432.1 hypothetical protein EDD56_109177 [Pseudobacteriovorax antillogorgiicola]SMF28724.1 hypothetical protein SAMN06296036_10936 [Pseudobacteriovorax antillogorgiicola]
MTILKRMLMGAAFLFLVSCICDKALAKSNAHHLIVDLKAISKSGLVEVAVENRLPYTIGWMSFTIDTLNETGSLNFENLASGKREGKKLRMRSLKQLKVRDVTVVDDQANTRQPKVLVRLKR